MTGAGRYAPSPTGELHLGNLRTALLAWLGARSRDAGFLVRIEDLDSGRSREHFVKTQLDEIRALGLDWDGEPVKQSERGQLYGAAIAKLEQKGLTYECFCTRAEIREASSASHGDVPGDFYPGTCAHLTAAEIEDKRRSGRPPALRVRAGAPDDFVVRRNDGDYAYHLAVVVDDADQEIDEVVRGADLLDSTPRQLWLFEQLGLQAPERYIHVPLMLGEDGARLAKRHGSVSLEQRMAEGTTAEELVGELATSVGLAEPGQAMQPAELLPHFDWSLVKPPVV